MKWGQLGHRVREKADPLTDWLDGIAKAQVGWSSQWKFLAPELPCPECTTCSFWWSGWLQFQLRPARTHTWSALSLFAGHWSLSSWTYLLNRDREIFFEEFSSVLLSSHPPSLSSSPPALVCSCGGHRPQCSCGVLAIQSVSQSDFLRAIHSFSLALLSLTTVDSCTRPENWNFVLVFQRVHHSCSKTYFSTSSSLTVAVTSSPVNRGFLSS